MLAASLPGREASSARVRLWRSLKDLGAANLRDGVTLVPASGERLARFAAIARDIESEDGAAWVLSLPAQAPAVEKRLRALFDRSESYQAIAPPLAALRKDLAALDEASARQRFRQLERELEAVEALDFFPGAERAKLRAALDKLRAALDRRFSPEEPSDQGGAVTRRSARQFQGQLWATRKRLWVDRAASAWLIRRFIDPRARFAWLDKPADCPADAHGFDFDGAAFTHVGDLVTFEVLAAAFSLDGDPGLARLGALVHYLDVGGETVAEAAGFEAMLAGLRDAAMDDDALLAAVTPLLDALYHHFTHER
jgi:hypothetical protein